MFVERITFDPPASFYRPSLHDAAFPRSIRDRVKHSPQEGDTRRCCIEDYQLGYRIGLAGRCNDAEAEIVMLACNFRHLVSNEPNSFVYGYIHGKSHRQENAICRAAVQWANKMQVFDHFPFPAECEGYVEFCRAENTKRHDEYRMRKLASKPVKALKGGVRRKSVDGYARSFSEIA